MSADLLDSMICLDCDWVFGRHEALNLQMDCPHCASGQTIMLVRIVTPLEDTAGFKMDSRLRGNDGMAEAPA